MKNMLILSLALLFWLSGCASSRNPSLLTKKPAFCGEFHQIKFEPLELHKTTKFRINSECQVFEFRDGKSFIKAFEIPPLQERTEIEIRSFVVGGPIVPMCHILYPFFILLDENYRTTRNLEGCMTNAEDWWNGSHLAVKIELQPNETYIVIYTSQVFLGRKHTFYVNDEGYAAWTPTGVLYAPPSGSTFAKHYSYGMTGKLKIEVLSKP